jgi:hypothetical protein
MAPLLMVHAFGVLAHEEVVTPLFVAHFFGFSGAHNAAFATAGELGFGAHSAVRAFNQ